MEVIMKLEIELTEDYKIKTQIDTPMPIDDLMPILFTVQLSYMQQFMKQVEASGELTPDQLKALKEDLYDKYNAGASNILYLFAPDTELRPDLTVEAMKEAEDKYMYNQLNRKARREVDKKTKGETKVLQYKPKQKGE
jgi:hypothetical protein